MLPYVLCFIVTRDQDQILMLHRKNEPNAGKLNGVGGKIEPGETPYQAVVREVKEETGIELDSARFAGTVTWCSGDYFMSGMYVYLAELPGRYSPWKGSRETAEGLLRWMTRPELAKDPDVVDNIPHFLPRMLAGAIPAEYRCHHGPGGLDRVERRLVTDEDLAAVVLGPRKVNLTLSVEGDDTPVGLTQNWHPSIETLDELVNRMAVQVLSTRNYIVNLTLSVEGDDTPVGLTQNWHPSIETLDELVNRMAVQVLSTRNYIAEHGDPRQS